MVNFDEEKQIKKLDELHKKEEEDLAKILSEKYGVSYTDLSVTPINTDGLKLIPEAKARENNIAVFDILDKKIKIAVISPNNEGAKKIIAELEKDGYTTNIYMVSNQSISKAWDRYKDISYSVETEKGLLNISADTIMHFLGEKKSISEVTAVLEQILKSESSNKISKFFDIVMAGAMALEASDVHIEPEEESAKIRYRLDGILINILEFDSKVYNLLLSRTKLTAGLKLNIKDNAQDGRFSIKLNNTEIEIRTSTMPGAYGESVVFRILNPDAISVPVEALGIEKNLLAILEEEISKPNGMIINTGPTGSGKTTTLYAFLNKIYNPEIKIITIEDPIEYHIKGITQTQTEPEKGYTFAKGLKSALRQDPDVIMVGEIRDAETAETAVHSALTGHLVLSTLHTNNAAGTFPRFIDLGVSPKILGSAVNLTMAQRLVRKLCSCKKEVLIEGKDKDTVERIIKDIDKQKYEITNTEKMFVPVGCEKCNNIGYKGRIGIFEAIKMNAEIEETINNSPSEREIKKVAKTQGLLNMNEDGIIKVLKGVTSIEELKRVVDLNE
ncbi:MAG: GspE/PulE family protein [Candidatus Pacebacteria bacterium]|nr:GspE/PulE family protein [Candidatus Paceibacterota bacterium]